VTENGWPWGAGSATGVGSLPGTDIDEAVKFVFGELPALPHLPELPARGPGADMIGRGAGFLTDLPVDLYAGRWRMAPRPGRDLRRTLDLLQRDLDTMTEAADGYVGPIKLQAPGPWTLAATLELSIGGKVLRDHGATRDLVDSLAEGLRLHVADVARRVPGATVLLQLDEPSLPTVLAGRVPTESGFGTLRSVPANDARDALRSIVDLTGVPVIVHCCAPDAPLGLIASAGAAAVSLDLAQINESDPVTLDALGTVIDAGLGFFAGAVPTTPPTTSPGAGSGAGSAAAPNRGQPPSSVQVADRITTLWRRLGFPLDRLGGQVVVTPACGLAGASPEYAKAALAVCVEAGRRLSESD
jgi:Cobalamin-independent synthase, Catalytic domain